VLDLHVNIFLCYSVQVEDLSRKTQPGQSRLYTIVKIVELDTRWQGVVRAKKLPYRRKLIHRKTGKKSLVKRV